MAGNNQMADSMGDLREDLSAVARDTEALLKATAEVSNERVQESRARAQTSLRQVRERLNSGMWFGRARQAASNADEYVHEHPWRMIGAAAGAGLLIGLLTRRS